MCPMRSCGSWFATWHSKAWFLTSFEILVIDVEDTLLWSSLASSESSAIIRMMHHPCALMRKFRFSKFVIIGRPTVLSFEVVSDVFRHVQSWWGIKSRFMSHPCPSWSSITQIPGVRRAQLDSTDLNALKDGRALPFNQLLGSPGKLASAHSAAKNWGGRIIRRQRRLPNPWVKLSDEAFNSHSQHLFLAHHWKVYEKNSTTPCTVAVELVEDPSALKRAINMRRMDLEDMKPRPCGLIVQKLQCSSNPFNNR